MLKFFASPKKDEGEESAEQKVAVHSVQAFGHKYSQDELSNLEFLDKLYDVAQLPAEEEGGDNVEGGVVLLRVLGFLATMLRDLHLLYKRRKAASLDPTLISVSSTIVATQCIFVNYSKIFMHEILFNAMHKTLENIFKIT